MTEEIASGTTAGFNDFCDWLVAKGLMQSSAVEPVRSATKQIIRTVEPDNPAVDLRAIDTEDFMSRFENLAGHRYSPDSLRAYRTRFNRGVDLYRQYLENGAANFKPPVGRATRRRAGADTGSTNGTPQRSPRPAPSPAPTASTSASAGLIDYPFPLQSGALAHLYLPARLEKADAERLGAYVRALVFDPQRQIGPGDSE